MQPNDHYNPTTYVDEPQTRGRSIEPAPDSLTRAFNDAIRPLHQQIADLKATLDDYASRCESLEAREGDMIAWIDKRGFRADVPSSIAAVMNAEPGAAATLNYQLDRRMTVVNHDLHRLQDNVSNDLPTTTFSEALGAMIPSIRDLAHLPHGSPFAFELLIKLGGNLNSHGGDQSWSNELDQQSRGAFYNKLDDVMVEIVKLRLEDSDPADGPGPTGRHGISQTDAGAHGGHGQGEMWHIGRDIKRLEQTGKFLKTKLGLEQYFPRSLMEMRGGGRCKRLRSCRCRGGVRKW
ncbi:MAG: hypothetical protein OHK93_008526 [Ramalina farinacea]|uniref:Uncharacterized protein n=1 Tax=Ramalina farinacea TaxID=258253 RepID=A0AA43QQY1_9LECA|nr:hypothetical protein [Ramalina farinacea]